MLKNNIVSVFAMLGLGMYFSGCATINNGIADGIAYSAHSVTGIPYPMKSGKIYIESTTAKDTQNVTPLNAQLHGFDNVVATNTMQCDSLPEIADVLTGHGWVITNNKEEADYQISTSVIYCGYADQWLKNSNREQSLKDRRYFKDDMFASKKFNLNITEEQLVNEDKDALEKLIGYTDVTKVNKNYFNVFDYKYQGAPENIRALASANIIASHPELKDDVHLSARAIGGGADILSVGGTNGAAGAVGVAAIGLGIIGGMSGLPEYSGYKSEVKIYDPQTKETKIEYIHDLVPMNSRVEKVGKYEGYKSIADSFASGLFYK